MLESPVISVIVPVYNKQNYIKRCLDSLILQTLDSSQYEIIIIDNNSTDYSLKICKEYEESFSFIKLLHNKVQGVSSTRNKGIENSIGKYLMYVDADDTISGVTLKNILDFFEEHENDIDIVTYPLWYDTDKPGEFNHFRYKYLSETGIYDVDKFPFLCQSTMNICVKKNITPDILFNTDMTVHEDQEYICRHIMLKNKIGFVKEAQYNYNHYDSSLSYLLLDPLYSFDTLTNFEILLNEFPESRYLRALFLYNLEWRLLEDRIFPYGLKGAAYDKALNRIKSIIRSTDIELIMEHPFVDFFHRFFFISFAKFPISVLPDKSGLSLYFRDKLLSRRQELEIIISKIVTRNGHFIIEAFIKDVAFNFCNAPKLFMLINNKRQEVNIFKSDAGRYRTHIMTNTFYGFNINEEISEESEVTFEIEINGAVYPVSYYFMPFSSISPIEKRLSFECDGLVTELKNNNTFYIYNKEQRTNEQIDRIWLYYDCSGVSKDNGLIQFLHDIDIDDGIKKYFIYNNNPAELPDYIYRKYKQNIIPFGDIRHKHLLFRAEKIITAYIETKNIFPFDLRTCRKYADKLCAEIIYLQHGVLHASLPWKYAREESRFDKIVVSSQTEIDNYTYKYNIQSDKIIKTGMPRFDYLDRNKKPKNRILFAPSWRSYLIADRDNAWVPLDSIFKDSCYYNNFFEFLNSDELKKVLDKYNTYLDLKLHPIFNCYKKFFKTSNERINLIDEVGSEEEYAIFITDFSSFLFDYVWLQRPIIYFIPDEIEFEAGLNYYRQLDIPFDKAFGSFFDNGKNVINEIERIIKNGFVPDEQYLKRMNKFFLPIKDCSDSIYDTLIK